MKTLIILFFLLGIQVHSQYKYWNFEYSGDYYSSLQKNVDYNKISEFIINNIDTQIFQDHLLLIPVYLPECSGCDEELDSEESMVINEISYLNFWNENTVKKFLKKLSRKKIIFTSDYYVKNIENEMKFLRRLNPTIGIKRSGAYSEQINVYNNHKKERIELDDEILINSDALYIHLRPYHNNVNGRERNLKTNENFLLVTIHYIINRNSIKIQYFKYDYDSKSMSVLDGFDEPILS